MSSNRNTSSSSGAAASRENVIAGAGDPILITGSSGFIGTRLVETLVECGFTNLRCLVRASSKVGALRKMLDERGATGAHIVEGNLLSPADCDRITQDVAIVYHLAAGRGEKSYADAFSNSVVTTRNLLDAVVRRGRLKRFVNVSSFSVYSNRNLPRRGVLDERCAVETEPNLRGEAYCYAKVKQDELVQRYQERGVPVVLVRPGVVYGPGKKGIHGRIGIDTFGIFLLLGGSNPMPLSYVDNCADAIALAGLRSGVDGEVFNVVDDDLPTARQFLRLYKREVKRFRSITVPYPVFYLFCYGWEKYSAWSEGQLPPAFNRRGCETAWKGNRYSNAKLKERLGWTQRVPTPDALANYARFQRAALNSR